MRVLFRKWVAVFLVGILCFSASTALASGNGDRSDVSSPTGADRGDPTVTADSSGGTPPEGADNSDGDPIDIEEIVDHILTFLDLLGWN